MKAVKLLLVLGLFGVGGVYAMDRARYGDMDESTAGSAMTQGEGERYGFEQDYHSGADLRNDNSSAFSREEPSSGGHRDCDQGFGKHLNRLLD